MSKRWKKLTALLVVMGCVSTLLQDADVRVSAKETSVAVLPASEEIAVSRNFKAVSTSKAEYLGLGRLYPFKAADGTGALYYFTTSAKRSYYQIKAFVTAGTAFQIGIYDETGTPVAGEVALGNLEYQRFALEPEKKYFLQISGSYDAAGEVLVSEVADDHANELAEAQEISLNKEFVVTTDCLGDLDYVKVTTSARDVTYTLNLDPVAGVVGEYEVLNEAGERLEGCGGVTDVADKLATVLALEPEKTYYLKFSSAEDYCQLIASIDETINTYKLTYHLDGGENSKENPSTYVATDTIALKNPAKKGYLFDGWFADAEYTKAIYNIGGFGKRDYDLYAKWKKPEPGVVTVASYVSKSAGKAVLKFNAVSDIEGYQIRITRIGKKKNYVSYETVKRTTIHFTNWKQGQKYYVNVRAYVIDSCGNRIYGAYSKTEGITVKKKAVKKSKKK